MIELLKRRHGQRMRAVEALKTLVDTADAASRDFTAEERAQWDTMNAEIDDVDTSITELRTIIEREAKADKARADLDKIVRPDQPTPAQRSADSDAEQVRRLARGEVRAVEFKFTAAETRDLTKGTTAAGGNTVPTGFVRKLYEHLVEMAAIRQTDPTVLTTESGEKILVPKTTSHGSAALVAEGGLLPENDPAFGQVELDAYKYGQLIQVSHELVDDNAVNLLDYLARAAGLALGLASGAHFITGSGTGQPNGLATAASAGKTGATGQTTSVTTDDLIDLYHSIVTGYRRRGTWLMNDSTAKAIRKLKDADNQYIWQPGLVAGQPDVLLGRPIVTDPGVAAMAASAKSILFGDCGGYYIRDVGTLRFERSDEYAFANDLVSFRAIIRTDGDLVDTNAVKAYVNSAT